MSKVDWKQWMIHEADADDKGVLGLLYAVEKCGIDMTRGIGLFLSVWFPDMFRQLLEWLRIVGRFAARIAVRSARASAVIGLWLLIVFGPLALFTGIITGLWTVIALCGSVWGLWRARMRRTRSPRSL